MKGVGAGRARGVRCWLLGVGGALLVSFSVVKSDRCALARRAGGSGGRSRRRGREGGSGPRGRRRGLGRGGGG